MHRLIVLWLFVVLAGCAPAAGTTALQTGGTQTSAQPARTLVAAIRVEPTTVAAKSVGQGGGVARYLSGRIFNAELAIVDDAAVPRAYLAESLPQLNTDSWRVFPDGRMETTYKLKTGSVWHDGTPHTATDFVFSYRVYSTPELGAANSAPISIMDEVLAADDLTVVIRWKRPYADAGALEQGFPPLPRHILEAGLASSTVEGFTAHPYWTREFIGLGPFRLATWEPGAFLEGVAYDKHVWGAPKIQRIKLLFMPDSNVVLASMLAGEVYMSADTSLRVGQVPLLLKEWGAGGGSAWLHPNQWRAAHFQLRTDYAAPRALLDPRVRKAMAHAVDKQPINEVAYEGQSLPSDSMIAPTSQVGRAVDAAVTKYPFDLRRSEQLMAGAGFTRGPDGSYTSSAEGRFVTEIKTNGATDNELEMSALAAGWRQAGFDVKDAVLPAALAQDNEARSTYTGIFSFNTSVGDGAATGRVTSAISRPDNRWAGGNRGAYSNPDFDRLAAAYTTELDRAERTRLLVEMVKIFNEDLPAISLFFRTQPWVHISALTGPRIVAPESNMSWRIHEWEFR